MKVFARCRTIYDKNAGRIPYNRNIAIAIEGFHEMGFEIHFYDTVDEIYDLYEKGDVVLDGIDQVEYCLNKFGFQFPQMDYPECLEKYLGRKIWKDTINNINSHPELWGNFVKPVKEKRFTGKIINNSNDLIGCGSCYEDYEVFVSEPMDFVYEVRGTVYYDQLVDLRPYHGSWEYMNTIDTNVIKQAMIDWKTWEDRPNSCTLDWGVVKTKANVETEFNPVYKEENKDRNVSNYTWTFAKPICEKKNNYKDISRYTAEEDVYKTVLVEANFGCCYGPYSTNAINYAKMISAAISQVSGTEDECYFGSIIKP